MDDDDIDIYEDLPSFEKVDCQVTKELTEKCSRFEKENTELKVKIGELTDWKKIAEANLSSLMKTAKAEIARKDRMIARLRRELDDAAFRRGNNWKKPLNHSGYKEYVPNSTGKGSQDNFVGEESSMREKVRFKRSDDAQASSIGSEILRETAWKMQSSRFCRNIESKLGEAHPMDQRIGATTLRDEIPMVSDNFSDDEEEDPRITGMRKKIPSTIFGERLRKRIILEEEAERIKKEEAERTKNEEAERTKKEESDEIKNEDELKIDGKIPTNLQQDSSNISDETIGKESQIIVKKEAINTSVEIVEKVRQDENIKDEKENSPDREEARIGSSEELESSRRDKNVKYKSENNLIKRENNCQDVSIIPLQERMTRVFSASGQTSGLEFHNDDDKNVHRRTNKRKLLDNDGEECSNSEAKRKRLEEGRNRWEDSRFRDRHFKRDDFEKHDNHDYLEFAAKSMNYRRRSQHSDKYERIHEARGESLRSSDRSRSNDRGFIEKRFDRHSKDKIEACNDKYEKRRDDGLRYRQDENYKCKNEMIDLRSKIENKVWGKISVYNNNDRGNNNSRMCKSRSPGEHRSRSSGRSWRGPESEKERLEYSKSTDRLNSRITKRENEVEGNTRLKEFGRSNQCANRVAESKNRAYSKTSNPTEKTNRQIISEDIKSWPSRTEREAIEKQRKCNSSSRKFHVKIEKVFDEKAIGRWKDSNRSEVRNRDAEPEIPCCSSSKTGIPGEKKNNNNKTIDNSIDVVANDWNVAPEVIRDSSKMNSNKETTSNKVASSEIRVVNDGSLTKTELDRELDKRRSRSWIDKSISAKLECEERPEIYKVSKECDVKADRPDSSRIGTPIEEKKSTTSASLVESRTKYCDEFRTWKPPESAFVELAETKVPQDNSSKTNMFSYEKTEISLNENSNVVEIKTRSKEDDVVPEVPMDWSKTRIKRTEEQISEKQKNTQNIDEKYKILFNGLTVNGTKEPANTEYSQITDTASRDVGKSSESSDIGTLNEGTNETNGIVVVEATVTEGQEFREQPFENGLKTSDKVAGSTKNELQPKGEFPFLRREGKERDADRQVLLGSPSMTNNDIASNGKEMEIEGDSGPRASDEPKAKSNAAAETCPVHPSRVDSQNKAVNDAISSTDIAIKRAKELDEKHKTWKNNGNALGTDATRPDAESVISSLSTADGEAKKKLFSTKIMEKRNIGDNLIEIRNNKISSTKIIVINSPGKTEQHFEKRRDAPSEAVGKKTVGTPRRLIAILENDSDVTFVPSSITQHPGSRSFREEKIENIEKFIMDYREDKHPCVAIKNAESEECRKLISNNLPDSSETNSRVFPLVDDKSEKIVAKETDNVTLYNLLERSNNGIKEDESKTVKGKTNEESVAELATLKILHTRDDEKISALPETSTTKPSPEKSLTEKTIGKQTKRRPRIPCMPVLSRVMRKKPSIFADSVSTPCMFHPNSLINNESDNKLSREETKTPRFPMEKLDASPTRRSKNNSRIEIPKKLPEDEKMSTGKELKVPCEMTRQDKVSHKQREDSENAKKSLSDQRGTRSTLKIILTALPTTDNKFFNRKRALPKEGTEIPTKLGEKHDCRILVTARRRTRPVKLDDSCTVTTLVSSERDWKESLRKIVKTDKPELPKLVSLSSIKGKECRSNDK